MPATKQRRDAREALPAIMLMKEAVARLTTYSVLPITYGFSIAYITLCVGIGTPSCLPSSATLPPSETA